MRAHHWGYLLVAFAMACLAMALVLPHPAYAQDAPQFKDPNCPTMAEVEALMTKQGEKFIELDTKSLLGVTVKEGGKILVSTFGGGAYAVFGIEMNGCLTGPSPIGAVIPDKGA